MAGQGFGCDDYPLTWKGDYIMTAKEMTVNIGKRGLLEFNDGLILFEVTIEDCRKVFDRVDYLVKSVAGKGQTWVSANKVRINKEV